MKVLCPVGGPEPGQARDGRLVRLPPMRALVVLPTYNEAETVVEVLQRLRAAAPDAEVLVVDDGSPDRTAELAQTAAAQLGAVTVLRRDAKRGLGDAYREGFGWGLDRGYEALIEMDADLSHDPAALPGLIAGLEEYDLVIGSRYVPGGSVANWGFHRRLLSWGGNRYSAFLLGVPVRDLTSGFRAYRADAVRAIDPTSVTAEGYGFQIEMAYRIAQADGRIHEVPIRFVDREHGQSKMSGSIALEALVLVTRWGLQRVWARAKSRRRTLSSRDRVVEGPGPAARR
jgi:dolichol-phosphate mannosyltransferase